MSFIIRLILCISFISTLSACSSSNEDPSDSNSSSTLVGNPSTFQVDPTKLTFGGVENTLTHITAESGFITLANTYTWNDLTLAIKRNDSFLKLLTIVDLTENTTESILAFDLPGMNGDTFTIDILAEGTTDVVSLEGELQNADITGAAVTPLLDTTENAGTRFVDLLCDRLTTCFTGTLTREACEIGIRGTKQLADNIDASLVEQGPDDPDFENVYFTDELIASIDSGLVTTTDAFEGCLQDLATTPCTENTLNPDSTIAAGYDEDNPKNFENVENIPSNVEGCSAIFTGIPETNRPLNAVSEIINPICFSILNGRYDMMINSTHRECDLAIRLLTNLGDNLGLTGTAYEHASLETILEAVDNGALTPNESALEDCASNIRDSITANNYTLLDTVYHADRPNDYSGVEVFVNCMDVF